MGAGSVGLGPGDANAEVDRILAELRRLRSPEHRATFCNHIGPNVTARRIAELKLRLEALTRQGDAIR